MRTFACVLAFALVGATLAQRGGRRQRPRGGRDGTGYAAPEADAAYAAPDAQPAYGGDQDVYEGAASSPAGSDDNLAMLEKAVPGIPGEDYPIYAEVPESGFACDGQVDGGYYADPEAECQVFHICTADGAGGLSKYSFLCPNGTLFNQNYFICDWWFNFDCSTAEDLYSLNDEIAAEREALAEAAAAAAAASDVPEEYGAPIEEEYAAAADYPEYEEVITEAVPVYEAAADYPEYEEVITEAVPVYEARSARKLGGRQNGRRGNRRGNRQGNRRGSFRG